MHASWRGVTGTNTVVGGGHLRFMLIYEAENGNPAYGQVLVDVESFELIDDLRADLQTHIDARYPEANAKVWRFVLGPGGGSKVEAPFLRPRPGCAARAGDRGQDDHGQCRGGGRQG